MEDLKKVADIADHCATTFIPLQENTTGPLNTRITGDILRIKRQLSRTEKRKDILGLLHVASRLSTCEVN